MKYPIEQAGKVVGYINIAHEMATEIAEVGGETGCPLTMHVIAEIVPDPLFTALAGKSVWKLKGFTIAWQEGKS